MNDANPTPECLACGACCFSPSDQFVWVTGYDWTRLGIDAERVARFIGNRAFMKMVGGHCAALEIRAGAPGPGSEMGGHGDLKTRGPADPGGQPSIQAGAGQEYFCTLYEKRPEICRALARGSPECEGERATKAL